MTNAWEALAQHDPLHAVASRKGTRGNWDEAAFRARGLEYVELTKPGWEGVTGSILEIGCGAGSCTWALAERFDRVTALDVSPTMLEEARKRVQASNVEFVLGDGERLPDGPFDLVFSTQVIQHMPRAILPTLFKEIKRAGKRAVLHIPAPTREQTVADWKHLVPIRRGATKFCQSLGLKLNYAKRPWIATEYNRYPVEEITRIATEAGLSVENVFQFREGHPRTTTYVLV